MFINWEKSTKKKYFKIWNKQIILQEQRSTMRFVSIKKNYALFFFLEIKASLNYK